MQNNRINSGITYLDKLIDSLRIGDNVIWQFETGTFVELYCMAFIKASLKDKKNVIFVNFNNSPKSIMSRMGGSLNNKNVTLIDCFTSGKGDNANLFLNLYDSVYKGYKCKVIRVEKPNDISNFIKIINKIEESNPKDTRYIFDSITGMQDLWGSDEPVLKFFTRQCPRLYELDTIAYWIVEKNAHSEKFRAQINHITQVVIDLSIVNGACGLTIFKSENRFSKDVLKPHKYEVVDSSISFMSGAGADAPNIGHKIRAIRQKKEISQAQLAEQIGVTPSTISQFESNTISLSLQALLKLSRALNVSIGDILEEKQGISSDFLFRAKSYSGRKASDSLYKGVSLAPVSLNNGESKMEAYMMSVLPGTRIERHFFADKREEFAYLLSGQIEIEMKKRRYILKEGDSLHLTAEVPDKWENNSDKAVRILWVVGK